MLCLTMEFLKANRGLLIVAALLLGGWLFLRTPATPLASASSLDEILSRDEPIVLQFFTNT
ncbi:MAG: hypothetical protein GY716_22685 [bacterium]|nr:hypothetical protein [bacterium]